MNQDPDNKNQDIQKEGNINTIDLDNEESLENQAIFNAPTNKISEPPESATEEVLDLDDVLDKSQTKAFIQKPEKEISLDNTKTEKPAKENTYSGNSLLRKKIEKREDSAEEVNEKTNFKNQNVSGTFFSKKEKLTMATPVNTKPQENPAIKENIQKESKSPKNQENFTIQEPKNNKNLEAEDPYKVGLSQEDFVMKKDIPAEPLKNNTPKVEEKIQNETSEEDVVPASLNKNESSPESKKVKDINVDVRPIRTYADDVKNNVQTEKVTTARILIEEQKKKEALQKNSEIESPQRKGNVVRILLTLVFIILGVGVGYYAYQEGFFINKKAPEFSNPVLISDIIEIEKINKIKTDLKTNTETIAEIRKIITSENTLPSKGVEKIELLKTSTVLENGEETNEEDVLSASEFLLIMESRAPDALIRSLRDDFILGQVKSEKSTEPFILFQTKDFEQTYAGMFEWEDTLVFDLKDIFYKKLGSTQRFPKENIAEVILEQEAETNKKDSTTETISPETADEAAQEETADEAVVKPSTESTYTNKFIDIILSNQDTRAILNNDGEVIFFYTIVSQENILITTTVESLIILLNKLNSSRIVR